LAPSSHVVRPHGEVTHGHVTVRHGSTAARHAQATQTDRKDQRLRHIGELARGALLTILTLALAVFCGGCAPENRWASLPGALSFDHDTMSAPEQLADVTDTEAQVVEAYNTFFGTTLFVIDANAKLAVRVWDQPLEGRRANTVTHFDEGGIYDAFVRVDSKVRRSPQYLYTLAHELGHVLGMNFHFEEGLMAKHAPSFGDLASHFDPTYVRWVCDTYGLTTARCR
jgi:hypothetical protein